jgi:hypothetical protein
MEIPSRNKKTHGMMVILSVNYSYLHMLYYRHVLAVQQASNGTIAYKALRDLSPGACIPTSNHLLVVSTPCMARFMSTPGVSSNDFRVAEASSVIGTVCLQGSTQMHNG